jgi:hypothetical protein
MKRRGFLGLFGAAIAVPALPFAAPVTPAVVYSRSTYGLAVLHARTRPHVTARGIAHCLKLPKSQASAMMAEMIESKLITPITGAADGSMRATSNILINDPWGLERTSAARQTTADQAKRHAKVQQPEVKIDLLLAHLRDLCTQQGMTLSRRCFA